MGETTALLTKGILFTVTAYALPLLLGWWLFLSGAKVPGGTSIAPAPHRAAWLAGLLGFGGLMMFVGGIWDAIKHVQTGQIPAGADFLWAPHIMIYTSFLITLLIAIGGFVDLAREGRRQGIRDPRLWVRQNPFMGAVALASIYAILSVPGDAIWHAIFGIDLTAWSPPHIMLGIAVCAVLLSAYGLLLRVRGSLSGKAWVDAGGILLLAVAVNVALLVGVLEWELPKRNLFVEARPIWLYPVVHAAISFIALVLARLTIPRRFSATWVALTALGLRVAVMVGLGATGNLVPYFPLVAVGGALALDLLPQTWAQGRNGSGVVAGLYALAFAAPSLPIMDRREEINVLEMGLAILVTAVICRALFPPVQSLARRMSGKSTSPAVRPQRGRTALPN